MQCEYIGTCGGCTLGDMSYTQQLDLKIQREKERFHNIYTNEMDIIQSSDGNFRNRAEFRIFHKEGKIYYAMSSLEKKLFTLNSCSIVSDTIHNIMDIFLEEIKDNDILTNRFFSIEYLSSSTSDLLVTMIYHKKLDDAWSIEARKLEKKLDIKIIGRSRKQKVILTNDIINEQLKIQNNTFHIQYKEGGFTQPNQAVNVKMIEWVLTNMKSKHDLCELYCGGGNFTLPMSKYFNKVLATEISKTSIKSAKINCELNNIKNIKFIRMSSEEFVQARLKVRAFRRIEQENVILDDYNFSTIFVDPPRAGLDETTLNLTAQFEQIIYISCNPETLHRDLEQLTKTHQISKMALFDQFAFTNHIECGVILNKI